MRKLGGTAALLGGTSLITLFLNFGIQLFLAYVFGTGPEMDAYVAAITIPTLLTTVLVAAMGYVVIPAFVDSMTTRGAGPTWTMSSTLFNGAALLLTSMVVVMLFFAYPLMRRTVPGLEEPTLGLAVDLLHWLLPATIFAVLNAVMIALYQAQYRFWQTAVAPMVGAGLLLGCAMLGAPVLGIRAVAIATFVGSLGQFLFLLPVFRGHYRAVLVPGDAAVRTAGRLLLPLIAGGLVYRATILADRLAISSLPQGSLSHVEYATRIATVINMVFASAIIASLFPHMSAFGATGDLQRLSDMLVRGQRVLMLVLFPALAIGWVLRVPLLHVLFERGEFRSADTHAVAALLTWFMLGVIGGAMGALQGRVYYVLKDTITPVILGLIETAAYFVYLPRLVASFGVVGVGMANAAYLLSALVMSAFILARRLRSNNMSGLFISGICIFLCSAGAAAATWGIARMIDAPWLAIGLGSLTGAALYVVSIALLRGEDLRDLRLLDQGPGPRNAE